VVPEANTLCLNTGGDSICRSVSRLKIFISAVTGEFGKARDALGADLRARGHEVTIQSDFKQSPDSETLLGRLAEYIRDCYAVIFIVGKYCGACPPALAAERLQEVLPKDIKEASYTQWEFFLARHYKRRPYTYIARDDYTPDQNSASSDRADLQRAYLQFLEADGVHYGPFSNIDQLARAVLKDLPEVGNVPIVESQPTTKPIVLPYPSIGDLFKGRDEFMERLYESLKRGQGSRTAIVSQALYGLGGIGKTRATVEYAWAHGGDYNALLFVVAETPEALRRNLAALTEVLLPRFDTTDDAARLTATLDWLRTNPGWFLILDNVDTKEALAEVERLLSGLVGGHVVVTSRLADFSGNFQPLELNVLAEDAAAAFLLARTAGRRRVTADDEIGAREVAQELGCLALALEQAAAYIAKRRLTFAQYRAQWQSKQDEVLAWSDPTMTGYPRAVAITWQTSVAQLNNSGRQLLKRLAWLAPEKVPESLLDVPIPGAEGENLREAYEDLASYSLVTRDAEGPFFLIHRLVQDVTRCSLAGEASPDSLVEALGWIDNAFEGRPQDVRNWPTLDPLAPHARTVSSFADGVNIAEPTARLMGQLGILLSVKALSAEAEPLMRRALAVHEKIFAPDDPVVANDLNKLAQLLQDTSRLIEAEEALRRALAIDEMRFGSDEPRVATRLNNLAVLLQSTHRFAEAEPLMRRSLAIHERSFGSEHPEVSICLNNLAQLLKATNRLNEAEPLMRRALAIDEKSYGPNHPYVAIRLSNLAGLMSVTDRLEEALPLVSRALGIDEKSFGPDHPEVATDLNNLAKLLQETRRFDEAEPLLRRAMEILVRFTRRTGHPHAHLEGAFHNYADLLKVMGKSDQEIEAILRDLMPSFRG
jgi:tetratricopeptide (TPR) repeat protein